MAGFLNLSLILELKCPECGKTTEVKFKLGNYFHLEGDFLDESPEQRTSYFYCGLYVFCDLKKLYPPALIKKSYDGYKTFEED